MNYENWELKLYQFVENYYLVNNINDSDIRVNDVLFTFKYNEIGKNKFLEVYYQQKFLNKVEIKEPSWLISNTAYLKNCSKSIKSNFSELKQIILDSKLNQDNNKINEKFSNNEKSNIKVYLLCSLDNGHYSDIEKKLREKKLSNFDKDEIHSLAYSIFAYWEGEQDNEPESIKDIINSKKIDISNSKEGYFLMYFEKNNLTKEVDKIYETSVYQREDALNYMKIYLKNKYKISKIFSKLPDGCKII